MNFWTVTVYLKTSSEPRSFIVQSPYDKAKTKEILFEVHPEYQRMTLKKTKKPAHALEWSI